MPSVHLDAVTPDAIAQSNTAGMRYTRCGWVDDIDLDNSPDPNALMKILSVSGVPQKGSALSATYPYMLLQDIVVIASVTTFRRVYLRLTYSTLPIIGTTYFIREDTYDGTERMSCVPGDPYILLEATATAEGREIRSYFQFDVPISMRSISVTSMKYGTPSESGGNTYLISPAEVLGGTSPPRNAHNYVNNATWPTDLFPSRPPGFWRVTRHATDMGRYDGYYISHVQATTKTIKDWSFFDILRDDNTGKPVKIDTEDFGALMALPYAPGVIGGIAGGIRVGFFPTTDFTDIFGF